MKLLFQAHPEFKPISEFKPSQKLRFEIEARGSIRDLTLKIFVTLCLENCKVFYCIRYIKDKPPGQVTALDWCIQNGISVWITRIIWTNICIYIGMLYGQLNYNTGQFLLFVLGILYTAQISCGQMVLSMKVTLVFKGDLVGDLSDQTLLWGYRLASIVYMLTLVTIGICSANPILYGPREALVLELVTSSKEPTYLSKFFTYLHLFLNLKSILDASDQTLASLLA